MTKLKCRSLLRKRKNQKGLSPLSVYLKAVPSKSRVVVVPCKEYKQSIPGRRIIGKIGVVLAQYSKGCLVQVDKKRYNIPKCHLKVV